jgi:hypothetical protein
LNFRPETEEVWICVTPPGHQPSCMREVRFVQRKWFGGRFNEGVISVLCFRGWIALIGPLNLEIDSTQQPRLREEGIDFGIEGFVR